ncbi:MAG: hypothetical protein Q8Q09_22830 [Deltaproteobacteria bacterium]|nr:hypothetical protein [Deltaproteobacteria bacterium]
MKHSRTHSLGPHGSTTPSAPGSRRAPRVPTRQRFECALLLVFVWLLPACLDRPVTPATPALESALSEVIYLDPGIKVDLLVMVDNSGSMRERQRNILRQLGPMIEQLTNPPCISRSTPDAPDAPGAPGALGTTTGG